MLRTAAVTSFLLAGPVLAAEDATAAAAAKYLAEWKKADAVKKAAGEAWKKAAAEAAKKSAEQKPSLRGADTRLEAQKNGTTPKGIWTKAPADKQGPPWSYFKLSTLATRDSAADSVQLMEVFFYANGQKIPAAGVTATDPLGYSPFDEGADKAVDGDVTTKFLDFQKQYLHITFASPVTPTGWSFVTGDDSPDRDPSDFTMEASVDDQTWTLVTDKAGFTGTELRSTETQQFIISGSDPSGDGPGGSGGAEDACGGGCAFLIIFFVGGFVYVAAGFAYNYKQKELRGVEAIPQVGFWKDLPFLVKDGALFVKAKVTGDSGYSAV